MKLTPKQKLEKRHLRIRKKVSGSAERPRLMVRKTLKHLHVQLVDDSPENGSRTLATFSTWSKADAGKHMANIPGAQVLGKSIGEALKARGITTVVFDRGGNRYHGVVKNLADSVRAAGIEF